MKIKPCIFICILPLLFSCTFADVVIDVSFTNNYFEPIYDINLGENCFETLNCGETITSLQFSNGSYNFNCSSKSNLFLETTLILDEYKDTAISVELNKYGSFLLTNNE